MTLGTEFLMETQRKFAERLDEHSEKKIDFLYFRSGARLGGSRNVDSKTMRNQDNMVEHFKKELYEINWQDTVCKHFDYGKVQIVGDGVMTP